MRIELLLVNSYHASMSANKWVLDAQCWAQARVIKREGGLEAEELILRDSISKYSDLRKLVFLRHRDLISFMCLAIWLIILLHIITEKSPFST